MERPTPEVIRVLESLAFCEITPADMLTQLRDCCGLSILRNGANCFFGLGSVCPAHAVEITKLHLEQALAKRREKNISDQELVNWATMILINDAFYWEGVDAELIGEWICRFSLDLVPHDAD
jgi:hypothetical protein